MKIISVPVHCTEKSYAQFGINWARSIENMSKYLLPTRVKYSYYKPILKYMT